VSWQVVVEQHGEEPERILDGQGRILELLTTHKAVDRLDLY
jgi:hypothetical protein